jgi:hypothetical protein
MPGLPPDPKAAPTASGKAAPRRGVKVRIQMPRRRWVRRLLIAFGIASVLVLLLGTFFWVRVAHQIDARLAGEARPIPRIFGQPFEIYPGRGLAPAQLVQRLNDVGYAQRPKVEVPGEFSVAANSVTIMTRAADKVEPKTVRVDFTPGSAPVIRRMIGAANKPVSKITLEAPLLAAIAPGQKQRRVPFAAIPTRSSRPCSPSKTAASTTTSAWIRSAWWAR